MPHFHENTKRNIHPYNSKKVFDKIDVMEQTYWFKRKQRKEAKPIIAPPNYSQLTILRSKFMEDNSVIPNAVGTQLDKYVQRVKSIKWFEPQGLNRKEVDQQIKAALAAFGIVAEIEYRPLVTEQDWQEAKAAGPHDPTWDAAIAASMSIARGSIIAAGWDVPLKNYQRLARDNALPAAKHAATRYSSAKGRAAASAAAWNAAWCVTRGVVDLMATQTKNLAYTQQFPMGSFGLMCQLWEMGLYPCGIIHGKFICYVPAGNNMTGFFGKQSERGNSGSLIINGIEYVPVKKPKSSK